MSVDSYEEDEVTRLIVDTHNAAAFAPIRGLMVGEFREWLLDPRTDAETLARTAPGITPEMAAAVSKLMRNQDLILAAQKCRVVTRFRNTLGLPGRLSVRLQPNHPTDDVRGIAASMLEGLLYGCGDAVIGVNPASDSLQAVTRLLEMMNAFRERYEFRHKHVCSRMLQIRLRAMERGAPVDLVFQSVGGTEATNRSFGVSLVVAQGSSARGADAEARKCGRQPDVLRDRPGERAFSGRASRLDQQTCEARAYGVARHFEPAAGEHGSGVHRAGVSAGREADYPRGAEDHFCGKLLGLPMGCDVCYTNHAEADQDDMDTLLTLLAVAGVNFVMGVPGADDVMLNYQTRRSTMRCTPASVLGLRRAPEFEAWLERMGICNEHGDMSGAGPYERLLMGASEWLK